ncbi:MAG: hypothetical protein ACRDBX_02815 [Erysipelotrichaceae bacterium]
MLFWLKRNRKYIALFMVCLLIMLHGVLDEKNIFWILKESIFNPEYRLNFFGNNETTVGLVIEPTVFNIMKSVVSNLQFTFDVSVIFGTVWFQIIIPLFATISGISFYQIYHSNFKLKIIRKTSYRQSVEREILSNSFKLASIIFAAYFVFLCFSYIVSTPGFLGSSERTMFSDLFGNSLFSNHTFFYFILEGLVRFFLIPFAYATLTQAVAVLDTSLKEVIAAPILYYYGLSAVGFALYMVVPELSIYINPSVIMASGSYDQFNTILLILINMLPFFIGMFLVRWKTKYVEL